MKKAKRSLIPKLNSEQLDKVSDIVSDVGLIALATVVLPALLDKFDIGKVILGLIIAFTFWFVSIWLRR